MDVVFFLSVFASALLLAFLISFIILRPCKLVSKPSFLVIKKDDYKQIYSNNFRYIGPLVLLALMVLGSTSEFYTLKFIILLLMFIEVWGKV